MLDVNRLVLVPAVVVIAAVAILAGSASDADGSGMIDHRLRERVTTQERAVAACMQGRGFEYIAALPADVILEEARAAAEARGVDPQKHLASVDLPQDPNESIRNDLGADDREAYADAFWGTDEQEGCQAVGFEQAFGTSQARLEAAAADRARVLDDLPRTNEKVQAAAAKHVACLRQAGWKVDSLEAVTQFAARQSEAVMDEILGADAEPGAGVDADDPRYVAHAARMAEWEDDRARCSADYDRVRVAAENSVPFTKPGRP